MKLTTTRNLIVTNNACPHLLARFDKAYPNIDPNIEIDLLDILNNKKNILEDVIWSLRTTKQDSRLVATEFVRMCMLHAKDYMDSSKTDYFTWVDVKQYYEDCYKCYQICICDDVINPDIIIDALYSAQYSARASGKYYCSDEEYEQVWFLRKLLS